MVRSESIPGSESELTPEGGSSSRNRSYLKACRLRAPGFASVARTAPEKPAPVRCVVAFIKIMNVSLVALGLKLSPSVYIPSASGDIGFFESRLLRAELLKRQSFSIGDCHSQRRSAFADLMTMKVGAVIEARFREACHWT